jgi:hypothetical protein
MKLDNKMLMEMIEEELELAEREPKKIEHDHEGRMAKGELRDMINNGLKLYKLIDKDDELPGWVSSYITLASDYMHSVTEYMVEDQAGENEAPGEELDDTEDDQEVDI